MNSKNADKNIANRKSDMLKLVDCIFIAYIKQINLLKKYAVVNILGIAYCIHACAS